MAATASSSRPTLHGQNIEDCSLQIDDTSNNYSVSQNSRDPSALPLAVTLRIYFDPIKRFAFFRLITTIELLVDNQTSPTSFFLDMSPERLRTLSIHRHGATTGPTTSVAQPTKRCLHFSFKAPGSITLIGPRAIPPGHLHPAISAAQASHIFPFLRLLARQPAIHVLLPTAAENLPLEACCQAISRQDLFANPLCRDPGLGSLRSLYHGEGGRIVDIDEEWQMVPPPFSDPAPVSSECPPPTYGETASLALASAPAPALAPKPHPPQSADPLETQKRKKRRRTRSPSPSSSNSSTPAYNTWAHFNLACGEREKMMAELLRRADKKESALNKMMVEADEATRHLTALVAAAKEREAALDNRGIVADAIGNELTEAHAATPGGISDQGSALSTASMASNVSERVQAYLTTRLDRFNQEIHERSYVSASEVTNIMYDEGYVKEDDMAEAIQEAIDGVLDRVRDRILDAFL